MQTIIVSGLTRVARFAAESMINRVLKWINSFLRRQLIGVWMAGMEVPRQAGILREDSELFLTKNSAICNLQAFFSERPRGVTVFWTPESTGKTYTLSRMDTKNTADRRFVYINYGTTIGGDDAKKILYRQIGLDAETDIGPLGHYLPKDVFFTFIFDHFDKAMIVPSDMISTLAQDSATRSPPSFNILVMVNDKYNTLALLKSCGQQLQREFVSLLGPQYCGRWSAAELGEFSDPRYNDLVDQCGTLAPMISIRNRTCSQSDPLMLLCVAKLGAEWEQGERLLGQYRRRRSIVCDDDV